MKPLIEGMCQQSEIQNKMETFKAQRQKRFVLRRASGIPITPTISTLQVTNIPNTIKEQPCRVTKNRENRSIHRSKVTFVTY